MFSAPLCLLTDPGASRLALHGVTWFCMQWHAPPLGNYQWQTVFSVAVMSWCRPHHTWIKTSPWYTYFKICENYIPKYWNLFLRIIKSNVLKLGFEQKKKGTSVLPNISSFTNLLLLRSLEGKETKGVEKIKAKKDLKRKGRMIW